MIETVTLDIGGVMSPTFTLPDASGLAPLVLPDSFLGGGESSSPQPSHDAVRRFEAAMGGTGAASADGARVADARVAFDIAQSLDAPIVHAQENDTAAELDKAGANQPNRNGLVGCAIAQTRKPALSARLRRRGDVLRKLHVR